MGSNVTMSKMKNPKDTNVIDDIMKDVSNIALPVVISKVNLMGSNTKEWWIDSSASYPPCVF